jgi:HlyD family secretion protein
MLDRVKALWANRPSWMRGRAAWIGGGGILVVLLFLLFGPKKEEEPYRTAQVDRGSITRVVSATGTLQPLVSANVGSTVSGPVQSVEVDFNSQVRAGQVLARLDPAPFQQRVQQAQAALASAQAQAAVANADYQRYARLESAGFASEQLMLAQRAARDQARASVSQAAAQLATARTDLDRSIIRSPITGVVVDKQVSVGQSVAASFQAATLFVIAQDLSRLQANITVDEADIGEVDEGQNVSFSVDAFPDREFEGRVSQVRQQGTSESGVVSYTVVVEADNPGRQLLPGMTANADIIIEQQQNVLRVPNTALRFRPVDPAIAAQGQAIAAEPRSGSGSESRRGDGERRSRDEAGAEEPRTRQAVIWVLRDRRPAPVHASIGIADSGYTQLVGGDLREGDEVIIGGGPQAPVDLQQLQRGGPGGGGPGGMRIRGG